MNPDIAIQVEGLSKRYRLGSGVATGTDGSFREAIYDGVASLRNRITGREKSSKPRDIWALKDVSFEVKRGEVLGVIGHNGAGKSTLLKLLARITDPTAGCARIQGRVASLLEVGTGFHPELSGRENIFLNAAILGMTRAEVKAKFDEIVDFAGIEKFLDTPVKRYSSGMRVRLAFAVAAHLDPEILIIDEVLAVGDAAFQKRCLGKMSDIAGMEGRTVMFVSHNMTAVQNLCRRTALLEHGRVTHLEPTEEVMPIYLRGAGSDEGGQRAIPACRPPGVRGVIQQIDILDAEGHHVRRVPVAGPLTIRIRYEADAELLAPSFGIAVYALDGQRIVNFQLRQQTRDIERLPASGTVSCHIPSLPLAPGEYQLSFGCTGNGMQLDHIEHACPLTIDPADFYGTGRLPEAKHGRTLVNAQWTHAPTTSPSLAGAA